MQLKANESVEGRTYREILFCLYHVGFWLPSTMKRNYQKVLYNFFSIFACTSIIVEVSFIFIDVIVEGKNLAYVFEIWFIVAVFILTLAKGINILLKRDLLYDHLRTSVLADRWTVFRDPDEMHIIKDSKKSEMLIFKLWGSALLVNGILFVFNPIIGENPDHRLMWDCYSPCDLHVTSCFWVCYIYQSYSYVTTSSINVAYDCLIYCLILRLCAHVKIFQHRLQTLPELVKKRTLCTVESEVDYVKQCITDHQTIAGMAKELHNLFNITVFIHFFMSFTCICTNVLSLTKLDLFSAEFLSVFLYFCCVLLQNLFYSLYGFKFQELTEEISYTIFSMDWTVLNKKTTTLLRFIMLSASKPMPLFNNFIVDLSPEMFLKVVKLSYSTFNVLKANK